MKSYDIAGYTFAADLYCPDHILGKLLGNGTYNSESLSVVEGMLDHVAAERGIDREDERSFDSDDFPKVIFADQCHDGCSMANDYRPGQCGDRCAVCHAPLGGDCPNEPVPDYYMTEFIQGYALCMLWANTTELNSSQLTIDNEPATSSDVDPNAWLNGNDALWALSAFTPLSQASIREDCEDFVNGNWYDLQSLDAAQCGHDFALTRNRHGAGFWDRGLGDIGDRLTKASHPYGESTAYYYASEDGSCVHLDSETMS